MNNVTASEYIPHSNHKQLYTNLSIGFGVFCFLSCLGFSYRRCLKTKKRKYNKDSKFIPRKKQKTDIETVVPSIKNNHPHYKTSPLQFYDSKLYKGKLFNGKIQLKEKNKSDSNEEHDSSSNSNRKDLSIETGDDAWEMVEKKVSSPRR